jgi:hypothetical protein
MRAHESAGSLKYGPSRLDCSNARRETPEKCEPDPWLSSVAMSLLAPARSYLSIGGVAGYLSVAVRAVANLEELPRCSRAEVRAR